MQCTGCSSGYLGRPNMGPTLPTTPITTMSEGGMLRPESWHSNGTGKGSVKRSIEAKVKGRKLSTGCHCNALLPALYPASKIPAPSVAYPPYSSADWSKLVWYAVASTQVTIQPKLG